MIIGARVPAMTSVMMVSDTPCVRLNASWVVKDLPVMSSLSMAVKKPNMATLPLTTSGTQPSTAKRSCASALNAFSSRPSPAGAGADCDPPAADRADSLFRSISPQSTSLSLARRAGAGAGAATGACPAAGVSTGADAGAAGEDPPSLSCLAFRLLSFLFFLPAIATTRVGDLPAAALLRGAV